MERFEDDNELHPAIQQILYEIDDLDYQLGWYELFLESEIKSRKKWELSEDESLWNQNFIGSKQVTDDVSFNETLEHLQSYQDKMDDAKILLRIYMDAFNGGWVF